MVSQGMRNNGHSGNPDRNVILGVPAGKLLFPFLVQAISKTFEAIQPQDQFNWIKVNGPSGI